MRLALALVLSLLAGTVTVLAGGADAAVRDASSPREAAAPVATDEPGTAPAGAQDASPRRAQPIRSPSPFAMGVLTLAALGLLYERRRRFVARHAAL